MRGLFLSFCALAVAFWLYGLVPFFRVQRFLSTRYQPTDDLIGAFRHALRDPTDPHHKDFQQLVMAYGAFLLCVLCAFVIAKVSSFTH